MELQLSAARDGHEPVIVTAVIEGMEFVDSLEYREALFDATIEQMKDALIREGVL